MRMSENNEHDTLVMAYSANVTSLLEMIGNNAGNHIKLLGEQSFEIVIDEMTEYLKMMKEIHEDYKQNTLMNTPMHNDSMPIHRNRISRSSRSRLNILRNSPIIQGSPMEVDRDGSPMIDRFSLMNNVIDESTFLDGTREMDESTNARGFLADISSLTTETVRSRLPSFNFDSISPDGSMNDSIKFDLEMEMPLLDQLRDGSPISQRLEAGGNDTIVINDDDCQTPRVRNIDKLDVVTPINRWNVTLRKGSNRKISEEIRKEIQRQLDGDDEYY